MFDAEEQYIKLMKSNRDLRMELFLYITELKRDDKQISSEEVAEKLIEIMDN